MDKNKIYCSSYTTALVVLHNIYNIQFNQNDAAVAQKCIDYIKRDSRNLQKIEEYSCSTSGITKILVFYMIYFICIETKKRSVIDVMSALLQSREPTSDQRLVLNMGVTKNMTVQQKKTVDSYRRPLLFNYYHFNLEGAMTPDLKSLVVQLLQRNMYIVLNVIPYESLDTPSLILTGIQKNNEDINIRDPKSNKIRSVYIDHIEGSDHEDDMYEWSRITGIGMCIPGGSGMIYNIKNIKKAIEEIRVMVGILPQSNGTVVKINVRQNKEILPVLEHISSLENDVYKEDEVEDTKNAEEALTRILNYVQKQITALNKSKAARRVGGTRKSRFNK